MKTINIMSAILLMASLAIAKPSPKKEHEKHVKFHQKEAKSHEDHEQEESRKEAKLAKKKAKYNGIRYKHEAAERKSFNNM